MVLFLNQKPDNGCLRGSSQCQFIFSHEDIEYKITVEQSAVRQITISSSPEKTTSRNLLNVFYSLDTLLMLFDGHERLRLIGIKFPMAAIDKQKNPSFWPVRLMGFDIDDGARPFLKKLYSAPDFHRLDMRHARRTRKRHSQTANCVFVGFNPK